MKLLIDIGNTSAKLAIADAHTMDIIHHERLQEPWHNTLSRLIADYSVEDIRLSSVAGRDPLLLTALADLALPSTSLTIHHRHPSRPLTGMPPTYGVDRYAADMGAMAQDRDHTLLVIDAGTCITYDLISPQGQLLGGVISPGVQLRLNAMHEHTAQLPLIDAAAQIQSFSHLMGHDTPSCMLSAAIQGTRFEIEGYIRHLLPTHPDLHVFLTGGNRIEMPDDIRSRVTFDPYLLFKGLASM